MAEEEVEDSEDEADYDSDDGFSKSIKKAIKDVTTSFIDESRQKQIQVMMLVRNDIRVIFGLTFANQCGFYVDHHMSPKIFDFQNWINYPEGKHVLTQHASDISAAVMSTDGHYLYTGSRRGIIRAWNMVDLSMIGEWDGQTRGITGLSFHSGMLVSHETYSLIYVWNARTFELICTFSGHGSAMRRVIFNATGDQLISCAFDRSIKVQSLQSGKLLKKLTGHHESVDAVICVNDLLISGSEDGEIKVWDPTKDTELVQTVSEGINDMIMDLVVNCDRTMLCCFVLGRLVFYRLPDLQLEHTTDKSVNCCRFHPFMPNIIAFADYKNKCISIYDVSAGVIIPGLYFSTTSVKSIWFDPDGEFMVSVCVNRSVRIWNVSYLCDPYAHLF